jgi:hypothetical protein
MTEFDPRQTAAFEPVTPAEAEALAAAEANRRADPVDEDGDALALRAAPLGPPTPPDQTAPLRRLLFPGGRFNRRLAFLAAVGVGGLVLWFGGPQPAPTRTEAQSVPDRPAPAASAALSQPLRSAHRPDANLGSVSAPPPAPAAGGQPPLSQNPRTPYGAPYGALAPPPNPSPGAPTRTAPKPDPTANPTPNADAFAQLRSFVIPLRDAARAPTETRPPVAKSVAADAADGADAPQPPPLPRGTRISLRLLEPVVTGAAAPAAAMVLEDVFGEDGTVLIPKGTRAEIPFLGYDANGRIPNNRAQPAVFLVADVPGGLSAKGGVKGADGRAGVAGLVSQERPGFLKRMLGASARVGSAAVGSVGPGDAVGEVERATGMDSVATISPAGRRVVEVAKGTPFIFIVGF